MFFRKIESVSSVLIVFHYIVKCCGCNHNQVEYRAEMDWKFMSFLSFLLFYWWFLKPMSPVTFDQLPVCLFLLLYLNVCHDSVFVWLQSCFIL
jgi:hypothetical protein